MGQDLHQHVLRRPRYHLEILRSGPLQRPRLRILLLRNHPKGLHGIRKIPLVQCREERTRLVYRRRMASLTETSRQRNLLRQDRRRMRMLPEENAPVSLGPPPSMSRINLVGIDLIRYDLLGIRPHRAILLREPNASVLLTPLLVGKRRISPVTPLVKRLVEGIPLRYRTQRLRWLMVAMLGRRPMARVEVIARLARSSAVLPSLCRYRLRPHQDRLRTMINTWRRGRDLARCRLLGSRLEIPQAAQGCPPLEHLSVWMMGILLIISIAPVLIQPIPTGSTTLLKDLPNRLILPRPHRPKDLRSVGSNVKLVNISSARRQKMLADPIVKLGTASNDKCRDREAGTPSIAARVATVVTMMRLVRRVLPLEPTRKGPKCMNPLFISIPYNYP